MVEHKDGLSITCQYSEESVDKALKELIESVHTELLKNNNLSIDCVKHYKDMKNQNNFIEVFLIQKEN